MLLPIIRDKSHDPFIIFGGLLSRDLITASLRNEKVNGDSLSKIKAFKEEITRHCPNENYLRKKIVEHLITGSANMPANSQGDIFYADVVVEVKNKLNQLNLDDISGSLKAPSGKRIETAEEELFRYMVKHTDRNWGVLTSGRVFRFYHKDALKNICHIEFDLFDIAFCEADKHASLFLRLLNDSNFRDELLSNTKGIRETQAEQRIEERVSKFFDACKEDRPFNTKACLFLLMVRYLEDIGVLPIISAQYQSYSLINRSNISVERLLAVVDKFVDGSWFNGNKQSLFSDIELSEVKKVLGKSSNLKAVFALLFDEVGVPINLSDIYIDHLGNIYQRVIHKHSEGAYYTPYSIGKKLTEYLTSMNVASRQKFAEDEQKVIVDPACGSGQLLRALIPFAHMFYDHSSKQMAKNSMRRDFISRLVGIDKDAESTFICKIGLGLMGAEEGLGVSLPRLVKEEDTLEAFLDSRSNFSEIPREHIFSVVTNPPWESLEFNESNLYRKTTGETLPKKSSLQKATGEKKKKFAEDQAKYDRWVKKNQEVIQTEKDRIDYLTELCEKVAGEHKDYFKGKKNLAVYFMFVITKLLEKSSGSYLVVMPDRFFVGDDCPLRDKLFPEFEAYVPFQNCGRIFEGVDNGTRFGIIFGRKGSSRPKLQIDIPVMEGVVPVDFHSLEVSKQDLKVEETRDLFGVHSKYTLPYFTSDSDVRILNQWMASRHALSSWQQGKINLGEKKSKYGKIGDIGEFKNRIVKSESRKGSDHETYRGVFGIGFGASIKELPPTLVQHYKESKIICPNVKRNGIRKIIAAYDSNCLVEHAYNFNDELEANSLIWIRSLIYNHLVNTLAGSYNINTGVLNFLGKLNEISETPVDFISAEVLVLKSIGFSVATAVEIIATVLLQGYEEAFIQNCYESLDSQFPREFGNVGKNKLLIPYKRVSNIAELASLNRSRFEPDQVEVRSVIAAYAVAKLSQSGFCGITKVEKAVYMLEATNCIDMQGVYFREAAGPLDQEALYHPRNGIQAVGTSKNFFSVEKKSSSTGKKMTVFTPASEIKSAVVQAQKLFTKHKTMDEANRILTLLSQKTTEQAELIATVYAAWNDLVAYGSDDSAENIVKEVRDNWTDTKKKFTPQTLKSIIQILRSNKLTPSGKGPRTFKRVA